MAVERLWAGWRSTYVVSAADRLHEGEPDTSDGSLFERILTSGRPDDETYVVHRGATCSALLNAFPYTTGHLLLLPNRAVPDLEDLDEVTFVELWRLVRTATSTLRRAYGCEGVNIGVNLGLAAGAGVPEHVHVHVLPRWAGDTNFMTSVADTRVMPEPLRTTWEKLRSAWPHQP